MSHHTKVKIVSILAGVIAICLLYYYSQDAINSIIQNSGIIPKVVVDVDKSTTVEVVKRSVPVGYLEFRNEKDGFQILYPEQGYSLCFNEMDCDFHDGNITFVSVVQDGETYRMDSQFFRIQKIGSSVGIAPADFANMIRKVNQDENLFVKGSETEIKVSGSTGYQFDVKGGFAWNGYTSDGDYIKVDTKTKNPSFFVYDATKVLSVVYFSQNDDLFQLIYENNAVSEKIVQSIAFSW